jgi:hypothetical protein
MQVKWMCIDKPGAREGKQLCFDLEYDIKGGTPYSSINIHRVMVKGRDLVSVIRVWGALLLRLKQ